MRHIDTIIIHCTATRPNWWEGKTSQQKVDEVRRWHVEDRGWSDIGYHYLIDRNGTLVEGRPLERTGAHAKGHNTGSVGISLFGGHGGNVSDQFEDNFTEDQDRALRELIAKLKAEHPIVKTIGHNEVQSLDGTAQIVVLVGCFVFGSMAMFILKERLRAWASGWR